MEQISCHLEMQTQILQVGENNLCTVYTHYLLFYNVPHAETVPCGNAVHKRQCFSVSAMKRMWHNEKRNHHFPDFHLAQLPSRKTIGRIYITVRTIQQGNCAKYISHLCPAASAHFCFCKVPAIVVGPGKVAALQSQLSSKQGAWSGKMVVSIMEEPVCSKQLASFTGIKAISHKLHQR